jgi:hypothetical protein
MSASGQIVQMTLSAQEKALVSYIENIIQLKENNNNEADQTKLIEIVGWLENYNYDFLERLSSNSPSIKNLYLTNEKLNTTWQNKLATGKYPSQNFVSIDGETTYTIYDLYMASTIYSNYIKDNNDNYLNQACEKGLYNALIERCKKNMVTLFAQDIDSPEASIVLKQIDLDTKELARIYWGIGYFQAGCILNKIATHFIQVANEERDTNASEAHDEHITRGTLFLGQSVKYFLCSNDLQDSDISNAILNNLTSNTGLKLLMTGDLKFDNWTDAKKEFQDWIKDDYTTQYQAAKDELSHFKKQRTANTQDIKTLFSDLESSIKKTTFQDSLKFHIFNNPNISPEDKRKIIGEAAKLSAFKPGGQ